MSFTMADNEQAGRIRSGWKKHRTLVLYMVFINIFIVLIGYILHRTGNAEALTKSLDDAKQGFLLFGIVRGILEIWVFLNWRVFVGWCRRAFKLGYRKTWFVYQCKMLWKMFMIFDIGTFLLVNIW